MDGLHWSAKFFLAIGVCVVGLFVLLFGLEVKDIYSTYYPGFDRQQWLHASPELESNPREQMVPAIIAHKLHVGMSRQEVIALLGRPNQLQSRPDSIFLYQTGWRFLGVNYKKPVYLSINLTANGQVAHYGIE